MYQRNFLFFKYGNFSHYKNSGPMFEIYDQNDEKSSNILKKKLQINPRYATINNKSCSSFLSNEFEYVSYTSLGEYFSIWGCHQINEYIYDRGLWIFGTYKDGMNSSDAYLIVNKALVDMNVSVEVDEIIVNRETFGRGINVSEDAYFFQCYRMYFSHDPPADKKKVAFFIVLCILLMGVAIIASIFIGKYYD